MSVWTALRTWVVGELVTAVEMNAQIRDNIKCVTSCTRGIKTTGVGATLPASTASVLTLDTVTMDQYAMWSAGAATRITITQPGKYRVEGRVSGTSGVVNSPRIYKNGVAAITGISLSGGALQVGPYEATLAAGDYLELFVVTGAGLYTLSSTQLAVQGLVADLSVEWRAP